MEVNLFGFNIKRKKDSEKEIPSVVAPDTQDGSYVVGADGANYYGYAYNPLGETKNENDLLRRYREVAAFPEVDQAINEIVDEALIFDDTKFPLKLNLEDSNLPSSVKKKINESFNDVLNLLKFDTRGFDIFRQWYIDGKVYYHILFDGDNIKDGIAELRYIDPRKIKKIRNIKKEKMQNGVEVVKTVEEYYLFNDAGIDEKTSQGVKLTPDSVVCCTSGLVDQNNGLILSHLNKAIKPANQLKMVEDALVIYRMTRAPERRIFYVDVGNLPKGKAEQYVTEIMNKFRNKLVYDATTGEIADSKRHMSMMEDFWMPRREGGKGTEITTLSGGQNLSDLADVEYFKQKLFRSLNIPVSRLQPDQNFSIGQSDDVSRDEIKFSKFIDRLRGRFNCLFLDLIKVQLISKGVIKYEEWEEVNKQIFFVYARDNHFAELKDLAVLNERLTALQTLDPFVGKYYSKAWVQKNLLKFTDKEIDEMNDDIEDEAVDGTYGPIASPDMNAPVDNAQVAQQSQDVQQEQKPKQKKIEGEI